MPVALRRRVRPLLPASALLALIVPLAPPAPAVPAGTTVAPIVHAAEDAAVRVAPLGTHRTGVFDESAAEIVAYHPATARTFVVNAQSGRVDVLDAADPTMPTHRTSLATSDLPQIPDGAVANSVDVRADGLVVVAVEAPTKTDPGWLAFADATTLAWLGAVRVGALPDKVAFTPDGRMAVVANEGEPAEDFSIDPEGSVSVVTLPTTVSAPSQDAVRTAGFGAWEQGGTKTLHPDVRVFGPTVDTDFPVSANLEPEYVAIDPASTTAYASLQEANAVAVVDLATATVTDIWPLGFKDHNLPGNGLDTSDRDGAIDIAPRPLKGIYQPDGIEAYSVGGTTYLVTANEGDAREWGDYAEAARVKDLGKDGLAPVCATSPAAALLDDANLGRLNVSIASGLAADGSCYEELYSFGSRSFSIWTTDGEQVFDSGDAFEQITAEAIPEFFNSNHSESNLEGRSDDKGPEPENLAIGEVGDRTYAFIGFERVGGLMVFDITDPAASSYVTYVNNRDFSVSVEDAEDPAAVLDQAGDLGPEGVAFVAAEDSPTGEAMVIVGSEVSGTTTFFGVSELLAEPSATSVEVSDLAAQSRYGVLRRPTVTVRADGTPLSEVNGRLRVSSGTRQVAMAPVSSGIARPRLARDLRSGTRTLRFEFVPTDSVALAPSRATRTVRIAKARTRTTMRWVRKPTARRAGVVAVRAHPRDGALTPRAGRVTVRLGSGVRTARVSNGRARVNVGRVQPGRHTIRATYHGTANFAGSRTAARAVTLR